MKIQVCNKLEVKTYTDITNNVEIQKMLQDIFIFEEAYRVLELSSDEEKTLEDCYRKHTATDDMPALIDGYLFDHGDNWYIFRSDDIYDYYCTVEEYYDSITNMAKYLKKVMENIEKEA